jgi:hypothetical protein
MCSVRTHAGAIRAERNATYDLFADEFKSTIDQFRNVQVLQVGRGLLGDLLVALPVAAWLVEPDAQRPVVGLLVCRRSRVRVVDPLPAAFRRGTAS